MKPINRPMTERMKTALANLARDHKRPKVEAWWPYYPENIRMHEGLVRRGMTETRPVTIPGWERHRSIHLTEKGLATARALGYPVYGED